MQRKQERYGRRKINRIAAALFSFMLFIAVVLTAAVTTASEADRMPELEKDRLCMLKVNMSYTDLNLESDNIKVMPDVEVRLAKVADLEVNSGSAEYTLLQNYMETEISFAGITASASNEAAAVLRPLVAEAEEQKCVSDGDGVAAFADLTPGMYLVYQDDHANAAYGVEAIVPMLLAVPFPVADSSGNSWQYEISMQPKTNLDRPHSNGRIRVTKNLFDLKTELPFYPPENTEVVFYVGLFCDEACTQRVLGTADQKLVFFNGSTAETVFENLPVDQTYYIAETDGNGMVVKTQELGGVHFGAVYPDGQSVSVTKEKPETEISFLNAVPYLPDEYYYGGSLTITKETVKNGEEYPVTRTFYAGIFSDEACKDIVGDLLELKLNEESHVSVTLDVNIGMSADDSATYYVAETDREGNVLENGSSLAFTISLNKEGGKVVLSPQKTEDEVVITNDFTPKEEISPTPTPSKLTPTAVPPAPGSSSGGGNTPRTGDDTPVELYAVIAAAAALAIGGLLLLRKKHKNE